MQREVECTFAVRVTQNRKALVLRKTQIQLDVLLQRGTQMNVCLRGHNEA